MTVRRGLLLQIDGDGRTGERAVLEPGGGPYLVGRKQACHLWLPGDPRVARQHCALVAGPSGWVVEDHASTAGTYIRGERIEREHRLAAGDVLAIGDTQLTVLDLDHAAAEGEVGDPQHEAFAVACRGVTLSVELARSNLTSSAAFDAALATILGPVRAPFDDPCALVIALREMTEQLAAPVAGIRVRLERESVIADANALALLRDPGAPTRTAWEWLRAAYLPTIASPADLVVGAVAPGGVRSQQNVPLPELLAAIEPAPLHVWMVDFAVGQLLAIRDRCRVTTAAPADVTFERGAAGGWEVYDHMAGVRSALVAGAPVRLRNAGRVGEVTTIALVTG